MQTILGPLIDALTWILNELHSIGLSWGLSIIGLTIIVRLILFPLTWKQFKSAQQMQMVQPKLKELQNKYKNDRGKLQEETMKLYQEYSVNPFASCLPLLLQLPVFMSLYYAIQHEEAIKAATFLGISLGERSIPLLVIYVITQLISTELSLVTQTDKTQKMMMRAMPFMFVVFLFNFPAGLFVYWITTNLWTIGQQLIIKRTMPKPEEMAARAAAKPKKKSRFMEAMMASQEQAMKQREETMAATKAKNAAQTKAGGQGKGGQPAKKGARKPPPGKGQQRKSGGSQGKSGGRQGKPGASPGKGTKPSGSPRG